jgi:hypothetical protein
MDSRVAILSEQSLFVGGIESRLQESPQRLEVHHIDPATPDYLAQIGEIQPTAILLDAATENKSQCCLLCDLVLNFPSLLIVRFAAEQQDVQIIKSSTHQFSGVQELIDVLVQPP